MRTAEQHSEADVSNDSDEQKPDVVNDESDSPADQATGAEESGANGEDKTADIAESSASLTGQNAQPKNIPLYVTIGSVSALAAAGGGISIIRFRKRKKL